MQRDSRPVQLTFATHASFKRLEVLQACRVCRKSYMLGFPCWSCGLRRRHERRLAALRSRECMTPGCHCITQRGDTHCGPAHRREQALELRTFLLSIVHTHEAYKPGHVSDDLMDQILAIDAKLDHAVWE